MRTVPDIIERLTRFERSPIAYTKRFRQLKHNTDLCPRLQEQVESMMRSFGKYRTITYDTQGIWDQGADVVLDFREEESEQREICFQIKSYDDLEQDRWLNNLKAQRDDAFRGVRQLHHFYIVLCTDQAAHRNKVRQVSAAFRGAERTFVIEPAYAWTLLTLQEFRIDAHVKRSLDSEDVVLRDAIDAVDVPAATAKALAVYACAHALFADDRGVTVEELTSAGRLRSMYEDVLAALRTQLSSQPEHFEDQDEDVRRLLSMSADECLAEDINLIAGELFVLDPKTGTLRPDYGQLMPVIALLADAMARYHFDIETAVPYISDLIGVPLPAAPERWER
jgi:hypothetical protein